MTYYGAGDLAAAFRQVRGNTIQIARELPEEKYGFRAAPDIRSAGDLLVHIALAPRFQLDVQGKGVSDLQTVNFMEVVGRMRAEEAVPRSKGDVLQLLATEGDTFASFVEGLTEAFLADQVKMPPGAQPPVKTRFEMLLSVKEHEMHHRGQLMVLQRILGLTPHLTREMQARMAQRAAAAQAVS
jgi:uncharacterized damage-inducible protein DinB